QFILSVGKRTDLAQLGAIPANFIVRNFVPQLEVLQRTDLFITHGGMNSVHESLWQGVPMIVIPQQAEQAFVAQQVVKHGAGIALGDKPPVGQVSAAELRAAVEEILGDLDAYRAATEPLRASFVAAGGYRRAAEAFMAYGRQT
ncbi:MAG: glycosyl transferase, partial [Anaerolineae bacterium]|nr:glycosyl transferase [Anaerolineae bacterium]